MSYIIIIATTAHFSLVEAANPQPIPGTDKLAAWIIGPAPDGTEVFYAEAAARAVYPALPPLSRFSGQDDQPVPASCTPLQMRRALNAAGLRSSVEAAVADSPQDVKDAWDFASIILRDDPIIAGMAAALGKSSADVDALFIAAAQL